MQFLSRLSRTCKPGAIFTAICRRDIAGISNMFETWCNFGATKIASSCLDKNRLCKRALKYRLIIFVKYVTLFKTTRRALSNWPLINFANFKKKNSNFFYIYIKKTKWYISKCEPLNRKVLELREENQFVWKFPVRKKDTCRELESDKFLLHRLAWRFIYIILFAIDFLSVYLVSKSPG